MKKPKPVIYPAEYGEQLIKEATEYKEKVKALIELYGREAVAKMLELDNEGSKSP